MVQNSRMSLPIDKIIAGQHDILNDFHYERILRIASSGCAGYTAASPSCAEFSLLKLIQPGPTPVRTKEFPLGIPNPSPSEQERLVSSRTLLHRAVQLVQATISAGGQGHLEQPKGALSWQDPEVQLLIKSFCCELVLIAACAYDLDWAKTWLFATSFEPLTALAATCKHQNQHVSLAGLRSSDGQYASRHTAEYPAHLAQDFAQIVAPLCQSGATITIDEALRLIPLKAFDAVPHAHVDGGGVGSSPDWSMPQESSNVFKPLRSTWMNLIVSNNLHQKLAHRFSMPDSSLPLSEDDLAPFRASFESFVFNTKGETVDWGVPNGQPFCLSALQSLAKLMRDPDQDLWPALFAGVPTGIDHDIPSSHVFSPIPNDQSPQDHDLSIHLQNWRSADDNQDIASSLLQEEIDQGFVIPFHGTVADAQAKWPRLAIGKFSIAFSDARPPRLVMDPTVSGTNKSCWIPEKQSMPTARDVMHSFPMRQEHQSAFGLDIKSAHKRVRVRPSEQSLLMFTFQEKLFYYQVCPFGASFSQHWWGRIGSFLMFFFTAYYSSSMLYGCLWMISSSPPHFPASPF